MARKRNEAPSNNWQQSLEKLKGEMRATPDVQQTEPEKIQSALVSTSQKEDVPASPEEAGRRDFETKASIPRLLMQDGRSRVDEERWKDGVEKRYGNGSWEKYYEAYRVAQKEKYEAWLATPEGVEATERTAQYAKEARQRYVSHPEQGTEGSFLKGRSPNSR